MQTITFNVGGMTCGGCVASVTRVLKSMQGVGDVAVTLAPPQARVTFDAATANAAQLNAAIEDAGYDVVA